MGGDVKEGASGPSDLRAQRVARTETMLIDAARALFVEKGYVATTLADVARQAGLAPRTVYVRFSTKATLFRRVVDQALVGDTAPIDVAHRARVREAMTAATLAERIEKLADAAVGIATRAGALFEVAAQAEGLEPELGEAARADRRATAELCQTFWDNAEADGLVNGLDAGRCAAVTDLLISADTTVHLRRTGEWSAPMHRSIIIDTLTALSRSIE